MPAKSTQLSYQTKSNIDLSDKQHTDYLTSKWGVSIHQLRAAVRGCNSTDIKKVEAYLRDKRAI